MGASSGPQPGAGHPAAPTAADPRPPEPPSALGDSSAAAAVSPAAHDATLPASHQPTSSGQQQQQTCPSPPDGDSAVSVTATAPAAATAPNTQEDDAEAYESRHVHTVYEAIAPHFSSTRYKPWPLVASFLLSLPPGSTGLDAGCGNGKYLAVNPSLFILASDRSANLVSLARSYRPPVLDERPKGGKKGKQNKKSPADTTVVAASSSTDAAAAAAATAEEAAPPPQNQVLVADSLALPYRASAFDFAISIAVVHHLSTRERRRAAVEALLSAVRPVEGKVLVMVWALEQGASRRGWDEGAEQDQLVSWVTKGKKAPQQQQQQEQEQQQEGQDQQPRDTTYQRYYHLYRQGELEEDVVAVGGRVLESGYERDNWWAIFCRDS